MKIFVLEVTGEREGYGDTSLFVKLDHLYPECPTYLNGTELYPLWCMRNDYCPKNQNCIPILARRVGAIFSYFEKAKLLYLWYAYPDKPGATRAGLFTSDFDEPKLMLFNRHQWNKVKKKGDGYWLTPSQDMLGF